MWLSTLCLLQAYIILNLAADLRSEFTWNTKQIFAYVNIEFETDKNKENQMVMWSAIIQKAVRSLLAGPCTGGGGGRGGGGLC